MYRRITLALLLISNGAQAHGSSTFGAIIDYILPFFLVFVIILVLILFFRFGLKGSSNINASRKAAEKYLGEVILSSQYCTLKGITKQELTDRISTGEIKAYESGAFLFVQQESDET